MSRYEYPKVRRDLNVVENFHGNEVWKVQLFFLMKWYLKSSNLFKNKVKDPYRWLEDPDSEETKTFVEQQNNLTNSFLEKCTHRNKIQERITELWNYPKYGCPFKRGSNW
jgi:prolyl oligopeptidase